MLFFVLYLTYVLAINCVWVLYALALAKQSSVIKASVFKKFLCRGHCLIFVPGLVKQHHAQSFHSRDLNPATYSV